MTLVSTNDQGRTRIVRLARSEVRNAVSTALLADLLDAVGDAVRSEDVRVIVVAAVGQSFSVGPDVEEERGGSDRVRRLELLGEVCEALATCPKATVAAVVGHCIGSGAEIAAACDMRVADPTASFEFSGAGFGLPTGCANLVGLVGLGAAKDLVLTGRTVGAAEAHHIGFVQRLTGEGAALAVALEAAREIAARDPDAVTYLKRTLDRFSGHGDRIASENDARYALAEAEGDYAALTAGKPGVGGWAGR